jgi:sugar lactone lactonase YvrE
MLQTLPERLLFLSIIACGLVIQDARSDEYADARAELVAAYQAQDFAAMQVAASRALAARPGYPGATFNLALAQALGGDAEAALDSLTGLAAAGVDFNVAGTPAFADLKLLPGWANYEAAIQQLNLPAGNAKVAFEHDVGDFVPEGIAIGGDGRLYLGSIRHGTIVSIGETTEMLSDGSGHWSVFGMRLDGDGGLWFASAAVPEFAGDNVETGRTGLFRLDLGSRRLDVRAELPGTGEPQVLGDLVFLDAETILATESLTGRLYRYSIPDGEFTELVPPGSLRSMQGLALDSNGEHLYVADYVGGLFRIALADNSVERVEADSPLNLFGIDGLYRHGDELIAIQNGTRPNRLIAMTLSEDGLRVSASRLLARNLEHFDEPTLGAVVGDTFYFVANSHWNRFDREGNLPGDLQGPIVMSVSLRP